MRLKGNKKFRLLTKKAVALSLGLALTAGGSIFHGESSHKAYAAGEVFTEAANANHWGRSDVRAWLNGLTKTASDETGTLPIDGSDGHPTGGTPAADSTAWNFLDCFTNAELALFKPKIVTTNRFKYNSQSLVVIPYTTKDLFWLPSGNFTLDQVISADPSYDLASSTTYANEVTNGQGSGWVSLIPINSWALSTSWLRSCNSDRDGEQRTLASRRGKVIASVPVTSEFETFACCYSTMADVGFAAITTPSDAVSDAEKIVISAFDKLGQKNEAPVPSWGMYLKLADPTLQLDSGSLSLSGTNLTFTAGSALPKDRYVVVQAYYGWDDSKSETENARLGDSVYAAYTKVTDDSKNSVTFDVSNWSSPSINGLTFKVWLEDQATDDSLAKASNPLTFVGSGTNIVPTTTDGAGNNPRVFAMKNDLKCSWGTYSDKDTLESGAPGSNATWQKLYIGTGSDNKPIEWWIAGNDTGDGSTSGLYLYQASANTGTRAFNSSTSNYTALAADISVTDVTIIDSDERPTSSAELTVGETLQLKANVTPTNATDPTVTWSSSNETVASVNENGLVTAVSPGSAIITATADDVSATVAITVHPSTCSVTLPAEGEQVGYELKADKTTVAYGADVTLTFELLDGYSKSSSFAINVTGASVEWDGTNPYKITNVQNDITVTVEGVVETETSVPGGPEAPEIETFKDWGTPIEIEGITHYIATDGTTSVEVDDYGMIWLKEESDGTTAWYGLDNSNGTFELGSRFHVRLLSNRNADEARYQELYNDLGDEQKALVESGRLWFFDLGVDDPDGTPYGLLETTVPVYIQIGEDWDRNHIQAVFISPGHNEIVEVNFKENVPYPEGSGEFAVLMLKHFSPYAVYDALLEKLEQATTGDNYTILILSISLLFIGVAIFFVNRKIYNLY